MRPLFGEGAMLNLLEFGPGARVPVHDHPHEQLGYVLEGGSALKIDAVEHRLGPGDAYGSRVGHRTPHGRMGRALSSTSSSRCGRTTGSGSRVDETSRRYRRRELPELGLGLRTDDRHAYGRSIVVQLGERVAIVTGAAPASGSPRPGISPPAGARGRARRQAARTVGRVAAGIAEAGGRASHVPADLADARGAAGRSWSRVRPSGRAST